MFLTWLRTIEHDLQPLNIGLVSAWQRAQDRERWKRLHSRMGMLLMMMMMQHVTLLDFPIRYFLYCNIRFEHTTLPVLRRKVPLNLTRLIRLCRRARNSQRTW